jgi:hypothetical protein
MSKTQFVSTKEIDYLDEDKPIRGQNYVCLSFISPEDVIRNKEVFYLERYMSKFSKDIKDLFENLLQKYPEEKDLLKQIRENHQHFFDGETLEHDFKFFKNQTAEVIEKEYLEANDFQTSIRGIKVRGVFETLKEAQVRAELLRRQGDKFDIFVGQVGVWCPWSPNPDDLQNQEYAETQLNTLVKNYRDNMNLRDEFYAKRKEEKIADAQEKLKKAMEEKDPWLANKSGEVENVVIEPPKKDEDMETENK